MESTPVRDKCIAFGDDEAIRSAFQADGYVVVTGVLSSDEVATMTEELWTSPRLLGQPGLERDDKDSWLGTWPQSDGGRNFLASENLFLDATPWDLASNPKLLALNQLLYGRRNLRLGLSRYGVMRPTRRHPEWITEESWLHWDQNPWHQPGFYKVQSFVCLTDSTESRSAPARRDHVPDFSLLHLTHMFTLHVLVVLIIFTHTLLSTCRAVLFVPVLLKSGGFVCVPHFQSRFKQWGQNNPEGTVWTDDSGIGRRLVDATYGDGQPFPVPKDDPCQTQVVRVVAPAGSMVLWDSRLPHQNFPNSDDTALRVIYYTNMAVKDDQADESYRRLLEQKCVVMEALGQRGARFPHRLSAIGKRVHCLPDGFGSASNAVDLLQLSEVGVTQLYEAIKLVVEAGEAEAEGNTTLAIQLHRRSMQLFPDIEDWHGAIYA